MIKTALYFGSFNPVHIGHIAIANYVVAFTDVKELWLVVTPHNPCKDGNDLLPEDERLKKVKRAIELLDLPVSVCDIEMQLPRPSYTIHTLQALEEKYPERQFVIVIGADSLADIERWKAYHEILKREVYVYPRVGYDTKALCSKYGTRFMDAPLIDISATFIRQAISEGKNIKGFLPCR